MIENINFVESPLNIENPLVLAGGLGTSPGQSAVPEGFLARFVSMLLFLSFSGLSNL